MKWWKAWVPELEGKPQIILQPLTNYMVLGKFLILFCLFPPPKERMIKAPTSGLWWGLNEVRYAQSSEQYLAHKCCASICCSCFVDRDLDLNTVQLWTWGSFFVDSVLGAHRFLLQDSSSCKIHPLTPSLFSSDLFPILESYSLAMFYIQILRRKANNWSSSSPSLSLLGKCCCQDIL